MMNLCLLALASLVQDLPDPPKAPFRARMTLERFVKREDRVTTQTGLLSVRPGEALAFDSRSLRLVVRDGKAIERRDGERIARRWDLSKPENFQPLDLWRLDPEALHEKFHVITDARAAPRELPDGVRSAEGKPVAPVGSKPGPSFRRVEEGADRGEGCRRVFLVPKDEGLRKRIASIRLSVDRGAGLILHAVVDGPTQVLTLTLSDFQEVASLEEAVFDWDWSRLKVEDR